MKTLEEQLDETLRLIDSYENLAADQMDDGAYVARGNGFCDQKFSDDFLDMQIAQLTARAATLRQEINRQNR